MTEQSNISQELAAVAPTLSGVKRDNVYSVPLNYFDCLSENVLQVVKEKETAAVNFSNINPYKTPIDYFDHLSSRVMQKISKQVETVNTKVEDELAEIAPLVAKISRQNLYSVPAGYFESLRPAKLEKGRVVAFGTFKRFSKYLVAALVIGVIVMARIVLFDGDNTGSLPPVAEFKIQDIQKLSEADIATYLESNSAAGDIAITLTDEPVGSETDAEGILDEMTDEEIQKYLKENPEVVTAEGTGS
jgi:hypothetical protein